MSGFTRILFATDFSKASHRAFKTAQMLARSNNARLTILHVHVPAIPLVPEQLIESERWAALNLVGKHWQKQQLASLVKQASRAGARATPLLIEGEPSRQIVKAARGGRASLIVVGTHGRTGFSRFMLGSVAERVAATSTCPVLTVRG